MSKTEIEREKWNFISIIISILSTKWPNKNDLKSCLYSLLFCFIIQHFFLLLKKKFFSHKHLCFLKKKLKKNEIWKRNTNKQNHFVITLSSSLNEMKWEKKCKEFQTNEISILFYKHYIYTMSVTIKNFIYWKMNKNFPFFQLFICHYDGCVVFVRWRWQPNKQNRIFFSINFSILNQNRIKKKIRESVWKNQFSSFITINNNNDDDDDNNLFIHNVVVVVIEFISQISGPKNIQRILNEIQYKKNV